MTGRALALLLLSAAGPMAAQAPPFSPGVPAERVVCAAAPSKTYALYLPSSYVPGKKWPVLYVFDARGRAVVALDVFRTGAERHGWIVVSSYDSRSDGALEPNVEAMNAMWRDTHERFPLDDRRVYATGFSGGARFSAWLALTLKNGLAGVILCGAGFPEETPPRKGKSFPVFGSVGDRDFNYYEMRSLDRELERLGSPHRLAVFDGPHRWPPPEIGTRAIGWMELQAMKQGLREKDAAFVEEVWRASLDGAAVLVREGRKPEALLAFESAAEDLDGLRDVADARAQATAIRSDKEIVRALKDEESRDTADRRILGTSEGRIGEFFFRSDTPVLLARALTDLRIPDLKERASKPGRDALSAQRILSALYTRTSFYLFREMREKKDNARALLAVAIAAEIKPEDPTVQYNLACQRALTRDKKGAIEALRRAIANGYKGAKEIEEDPDLASLRGDPAFQELLAELKKG